MKSKINFLNEVDDPLFGITNKISFCMFLSNFLKTFKWCLKSYISI